MTTIEDKIYNTIKMRQTTSFAEIEKAVPEIKGKVDWYYSGRANVILWSDMNEEAVHIMTKMLQDKKIFALPAIEFGHLTYLYDGALLAYPIVDVREMLKKDFEKYEEPHWFPIVFNTYPSEQNLYFGVD